MKRNFILAASLALVFAGVSCEKHSWNDKVKEVKEITTDEDGEAISTSTTLEIEEKGAVRFFKEESHGHKAEHSDKKGDH